MSDLDTLRWGDTQGLSWKGTGGAAPITPIVTKQLLAAHWRWPILWGVRVSLVPQIPAAETATFTVTVTYMVGAGQTAFPVVFTYAIAPTAGIYLPVNDLQPMPAADIQATITVTGTPAQPATVSESLQVGIVAAPYTEPHGTTRMYEWLDASPDERNGKRFMDGTTFDDGRLHYQQR